MKEYLYSTPTPTKSLKKYYSLFLLFFTLAVRGQAPSVRPALLHGAWTANWITCGGIAQRAYGVYHFRKSFTLDTIPRSLIVHVSADNRYRLFVNDYPVCSGPARGDLAHWNFETVDLAPFLGHGRNVVSALVWNMGEYAAVGQISNQTAFLLQSDDVGQEFINTNTSWKVMRDSAYSPCATDMGGGAS